MNLLDKVAVQATLDRLGLGASGRVKPAQLVCADGATLVSIARSVPSAPVEEVFAEVMGNVSVAAYAAVWEDRTDLLRGLVRIKGSYPELLSEDFSDEEVGAIALSSTEALLLFVEEAPQLATQAAMVMDGPALRLDLLGLGLGVDAHELFRSGASDVLSQAKLLGAFLADPEGTRDIQPLALSMMSETFSLLFVTLALDVNLATALGSFEASSELSGLFAS